MGSQRVRHDGSNLACMDTRSKLGENYKLREKLALLTVLQHHFIILTFYLYDYYF